MFNRFGVILLFSLMSICSSCLKKMAQSKMADPKDAIYILKKTITPEELNQLKATTTVFFYRKETEPQLDSLKQAITAAWDLTRLDFEDLDAFSVYAADPKTSYFIIEGITTTVTTQTSSYETTHYYLALKMYKGVDKKGKTLTTGLCRIELYPNSKTLFTGPRKKNADAVITNLYDNGVFFNWSPVLLAAQIQTVQTNLKNNLRPWLFQDVKNDNLPSLLAKDTLYVPKSVLMEFNAFSGKEKAKTINIFGG